MTLLVLTGSIQKQQSLTVKAPFDKQMRRFLLLLLSHVLVAAATGLGEEDMLYIYCTTPISLLYGPMLYTWADSLKGKQTGSLSLSLHLVPAILFLVPLAVLIASRGKLVWAYYDHVTYFSLLLSWTLYPLALISKRSKQHPQQQSSLLLSIDLVFLGLALYLLSLSGTKRDLKPDFLTSVFSFYIFGSLLVVAFFIFFYLIRVKREWTLPTQGLPSEESEKEHPRKQAIPAYSKSRIDPEQMQHYLAQIDRYMQQQPYLNPQLSLEEFASETKIYKHHCSQILNKIYGQNFSQFINSKRIDYACRLLTTPDLSMNMEELAEHCGFNSKASFYRNFNQYQHSTPSEYREKALSQKMGTTHKPKF